LHGTSVKSHLTSEGSQESETVPSVSSARTSLRHSRNRLASGIATLQLMSGLDAPQASTPPLRSRSFPRSLRSPRSPSPEPLQTPSAPLLRSCLLRRPDPHVRRSWPLWSYSTVVACSRETVIPRISLFPPVACRGLRPCPLHTFASREDAATAATSQLSKVHRPTKLTHAASAVPIRPASPARRESRLCIYTGNGKRLPPPGSLLLVLSRKFAIFVLLAWKSSWMSALGSSTSEIPLSYLCV